jgi:hypothetical protein
MAGQVVVVCMMLHLHDPPPASFQMANQQQQHGKQQHGKQQHGKQRQQPRELQRLQQVTHWQQQQQQPESKTL